MASRFSAVPDRVSGKGADGWAVHFAASQARLRGEDVIMLSIGDPEFATPEPIIDRATEALRAGDTHYAEIKGRHPLREAIARYVNRLSGTSYGPDNIIVCGGTQNALFNASLCILGDGDEVVAADPTYLTYEATLRAGGASLVTVEQPADGGFRLDVGAIERAITPATKAIMINTPANPTGVVASAGEIKDLADLARAAGLWVLSDEVYADLVFEGDHVSIAAEPGMHDSTVIVGAVSKSHAMTGWRAGWAAGPADLIRHMDRLSLAMTYGLPGFIQEATIVALRDHDHDVADMRATYRRRRDLLIDRLSDTPGIRVEPPQAGMFVLVDVRGTGMTSEQFSWRLFESTGVAVLDAANFGPGADGFVRISFTIADDDLDEACRRIRRFCIDTEEH